MGSNLNGEVRLYSFTEAHNSSFCSKCPKLGRFALIIVCRCDEDGRRASSTPAKFEALDALGFGKRGGRILIATGFPCRALRVLLVHPGEPQIAPFLAQIVVFSPWSGMVSYIYTLNPLTNTIEYLC